MDVTRDQFVSFLNITPSEQTESWKLLGEGITEYTINLNPQIKTSKYINTKVSKTRVSGYQPQGDISQEIKYGDDCYDFVNELRRSEATGDGLKSQILDIDKYDSTSANNVTSYVAIKHDCIVVPTTYGGGEDATIGYSLYYNSEGVQGTVVFANGIPTFTANA